MIKDKQTIEEEREHLDLERSLKKDLDRGWYEAYVNDDPAEESTEGCEARLDPYEGLCLRRFFIQEVYPQYDLQETEEVEEWDEKLQRTIRVRILKEK